MYTRKAHGQITLEPWQVIARILDLVRDTFKRDFHHTPVCILWHRQEDPLRARIGECTRALQRWGRQTSPKTQFPVPVPPLLQVSSERALNELWRLHSERALAPLRTSSGPPGLSRRMPVGARPCDGSLLAAAAAGSGAAAAELPRGRHPCWSSGCRHAPVPRARPENALRMAAGSHRQQLPQGEKRKVSAAGRGRRINRADRGPVCPRGPERVRTPEKSSGRSPVRQDCSGAADGAGWCWLPACLPPVCVCAVCCVLLCVLLG
jgi:hypothetical protein